MGVTVSCDRCGKCCGSASTNNMFNIFQNNFDVHHSYIFCKECIIQFSDFIDYDQKVINKKADQKMRDIEQLSEIIQEDVIKLFERAGYFNNEREKVRAKCLLGGLANKILLR